MANLNFNSVELSTYGLVTPGVQGTHDLAGVIVSQTFVPGYALPNETVLRDDLISMSIPCIVVGTDHADLVSKLHVLRTYLSPRLGWKYLTVTDVGSKRTLVRFEGFPIKIDQLPYLQTIIEFTLKAFRAPWWEDSSAQTDTITDSPDSITNTGDLECWPVYTATVGGAAMAGGLWFTVGGQKWEYDHALAPTDALVVTTELPDCTKNTTRDLHGVTIASIYPGLGVGVNAIVLSDDSKFSLGVSWRRRYE